jgi:hypothetical protein
MADLQQLLKASTILTLVSGQTIVTLTLQIDVRIVFAQRRRLDRPSSSGDPHTYLGSRAAWLQDTRANDHSEGKGHLVSAPLRVPSANLCCRPNSDDDSLQVCVTRPP